MNKAFKEGYKEMKAPSELKSRTLAEILKENERMKENADKIQKNTGKIHIYRYGILLAACAAVLCLVIFWPSKAVYVTPLEEGIYYEEIMLKDGRIQFIENRVAISITPNAGQLVIGDTKEADKEEHGGNFVQENTKSGGSLICRESNEILLPEIREDAWSNIGKQKIYVTVLKTEEERYQAVYEKDEIAYEVIGTNVTQKEFIDFLYKQVK